jgi:lipid II:glycine glycyltransferase (peptidoglycan interpeptide bridge formation enzyme)
MQVISNPDKVNRKEWSDFVYNHPNGNIFQTPEMFEVYSNTKNYTPIFLAIIKNNRITALLLAVIQKEHSDAVFWNLKPG